MCVSCFFVIFGPPKRKQIRERPAKGSEKEPEIKRAESAEKALLKDRATHQSLDLNWGEFAVAVIEIEV